MSTEIGAVVVLPRAEHPGDGLEGEGAPAGLGGERLDDAARAVAAGLRLRSVRVENVDIGIGVLAPGIVDRHDLVELACADRLPAQWRLRG